jgi:hypothetical protein
MRSRINVIELEKAARILGKFTGEIPRRCTHRLLLTLSHAQVSLSQKVESCASVQRVSPVYLPKYVILRPAISPCLIFCAIKLIREAEGETNRE